MAQEDLVVGMDWGFSTAELESNAAVLLHGSSSQDISGWPWLDTCFWLIMSVVTLALIALPRCTPTSCRILLRHLGFGMLHVANYATNIATLIFLFRQSHYSFWPCAAVHLTVGVFCIYTAMNTTSVRSLDCPCIVKWPFIVLILGLMQGVQVKLSWDSYKKNADAVPEPSSALRAPALMPTRFHIKAMDGLIEGSVFAVTVFKILAIELEHDGMLAEARQSLVYTFCGIFNIFTISFALLDLDYRTSVVVQQTLDKSLRSVLCHFTFRASEVLLRILTLIMLSSFSLLVLRSSLLDKIIAFADYLMGVILLVVVGRRDPQRETSFLLGLPLFIANVLQFTDVPVLAYQARRLSFILVIARSCQLLVVVVLCTYLASDHSLFNHPAPWKTGLAFFSRYPICMLWAASLMLYYCFYFGYAICTKSEADLYSAVADGDVPKLRGLLQGDALVLDVNRCGPDGLAPLHLAALKGKVQCIRLLVPGRANLRACTADGHQNTAVHLAAMRREADAVKLLVQHADSALLNAQNARGDTALHVAARRKNLEVLRVLLAAPGINFRLRNGEGRAPAECAASKKNFLFDRTSGERDVLVLFSSAELESFPSIPSDSLLSSIPVESAEPVIPVNTEAADASTEMPPDTSERLVPLLPVTMETGEAFLQQCRSPELSYAGLEPASSCGLCSFMLSSGVGAVSRAFLSSIREEDCTADPGDTREQSAVSLSDFSVLQVIGKGSFGRVDLVRQKHSRELFAMKLLNTSKYRAERITHFAFSEQYILKTTQHPLIVSLHYAFQTAIHWVLVMEYCPEGDLMHYLTTNGKPGISIKDFAQFGGQVLLALEHLHAIRVIFRDLKPENIVLDAAFNAKLTDFGLAKKLDLSASARTACGTPGYVAPELLMRAGAYTFEVDMYSYGVCMYVLLSGGTLATDKRAPPKNHSDLMQSIREAESSIVSQWSVPSMQTIPLLKQLTNAEPGMRPTASQAKRDPFFLNHLGHPVDDLMPRPQTRQ